MRGGFCLELTCLSEAPTTQIQCDHGKEPTPGFSVGGDNLLQYKGSSKFFACPATDTEYNIYVSPNFGQEKCFPITLKSSGCGAEASSSCPGVSASTVWITQWATETVSVAVTSTITSVESCPVTESSIVSTSITSQWTNTTVPCGKCSGHGNQTHQTPPLAPDSSTAGATMTPILEP